MPSRDEELRQMQENDPQPGMSTFDRNWNAANGVDSIGRREEIGDMASQLRERAGALTARHIAIVAGDRVTSRIMLDAAFACASAADEIDRLKRRVAERVRITMVCAMCGSVVLERESRQCEACDADDRRDRGS